MLFKLDCEESVTESMQGKIYTIYENLSVSNDTKLSRVSLV